MYVFRCLFQIYEILFSPLNLIELWETCLHKSTFYLGRPKIDSDRVKFMIIFGIILKLYENENPILHAQVF